MATYEQLALFNYVKELMQLEAAERLDELCQRLEACEQHIAALEARTAEPPRRGPGRPRKQLNG